MPLLLIIFFFLTFQAGAAPLTDESIRSARKIKILTGSFDPWTVADEVRARELITSGEADLIIVVPETVKSIETPIPAQNRVVLIDASLNSDVQITYTAESSLDLTQRIRTINPASTVTSASVPASRYPTEFRKWMSQNTDQYFGAGRTPPPEIPRAVYDKILDDGLYLGRQLTDRSFFNRMLTLIVHKTTSLGLYDKVRAFAVKIMARPNMREMRLGSETVKIDRYLASGLTGDAYIATIDGKRMVLKVAKNAETARKSMKDAALAHAWLSRTTSIILPELRDMGPNGEYQVLELVEGEQLDKFIARNSGVIPLATEIKLQKLFDEAAEINRRSAIKLDISADNIFIRAKDGAVVLVDFGPIRPEDIFAADFNTARARWISAANARIPAASVPVSQSCGIRALNKLLSQP